MNCGTVIPLGAAQQACVNEQLNNIIYFKNTFSFDNIDAVKNIETWRAGIQESATLGGLSIYPTLDVNNAAANKPAANEETDGSGAVITTRFSPGDVTITHRTNACDFKEMLRSMNGAFYNVAIGLGTNKVLLYEKKNGKLQGFTGQCNAIPTGVPAKDAKLEEMQVKINWQYENEWRNYRIIELPFDLSELTEYTPLGLQASIITALSGTDMLIEVKQSCLGTLESDTLTGEIIGTNVTDTPAVTVSAPTNGRYTVTLEKGAVPGALAAGDYINYRLVKKTANIYDKISEEINGRLWS